VARARAIVGVELLVGTALMFLLAVITVDAIRQYRIAADESFWRRAALYAADAQLQRFRAGAALDSLPPAGILPENITLKTSSEPGAGQWTGLMRVSVTAAVELSSGRTVRETVAGYLRTEGAR
jgi:hypothetical protein